MKRAVQFAVVREDPALESALVERIRARSALLVASGGCTALTLRTRHPELRITLVDANPAQLELVRKKIEALGTLRDTERDLAFNVESADPGALNACGNFESLFRQLRLFWEEFVFSEGKIIQAFRHDAVSDLLEEARASRYWPVSFALFFSDPLLNAIFGPEAIRHAPRGSYPEYFRAVIERGLSSPQASGNRFLQHIFLGQYLRDARPEYLLLQPGEELHIDLVQSTIDEAPHFGDHDLVSLSNIFDWSDGEYVARVAARCAREMKPGSALLFRQLNNQADFQSPFAESFRFDPALASELHDADQSLFYSKINVGFRRA